MGMFDWFRLPEEPDVDYQTKDFERDLDWYTLDVRRRIVYLKDESRDSRRRATPSHIGYNGTLELIGGDGDTYHTKVARVNQGVVGPFYPSYWALYEAEQKAKRKGKCYKPKPKVKYLSKAEQARRQELDMVALRTHMMDHMRETMNRKGFARRLLERINQKDAA